MRWLAYASLWLFIFCIPWDKSIVIPGVGVISRIVGMVAVGLSLVVVVVSGQVRSWRAFHIAALLFLVWAGAVLWVNSYEADLPLQFWTYAQLFLVLWMVWELAPSRLRQAGLFMAYVLGSIVTSMQTILAYRTHGTALRRFSAGTTDPNAVAMTLALGLPMAWHLGMTHRRPLLRWICRAYLPIGLFALALTGSRGGLLAAMVGLLIVPLTMTKLSPGKVAIAIALLSLSGALAVAYVPQTVVQRLATTGSSVQDLSMGGRLEIWKAGMQAFAHRPIVGYGAGAFKLAAAPYINGEPRVAHNSFLTVLVEQGLVGFLLYLTMFGVVFVGSMNLPTLERRFALVLFATLIVTMLPLSLQDSKPVWFILAALCAFASTQRRRIGASVPRPRPWGSTPPRSPRGARPRPPLSAPVRPAGPDRSI
jgi:O-antigen ligase